MDQNKSKKTNNTKQSLLLWLQINKMWFMSWKLSKKIVLQRIKKWSFWNLMW